MGINVLFAHLSGIAQSVLGVLDEFGVDAVLMHPLPVEFVLGW